MKLKVYAKAINILLERFPDAEVYYSIDDEGNHYMPVYYEPSVHTKQSLIGAGKKNDVVVVIN